MSAVPEQPALAGGESREIAVPRLIDAHAEQLYAVGLRFFGRHDLAEDVVQETFLQAFRKWHQFEGRSSASTWLYRIAWRVCRRLSRKRAGEPERMESLEELLPIGEPRIATIPDERDGPLLSRMRREGTDRIERAIVTLPADFRMPLVLKEIAGLSLAEVASVLGIKEATVKTRLYRARCRLRNALDDVLEKQEFPAPVYSKQVCLDLLRAKQEALDRGVPFEFPDRVVCERCSAYFDTLDLAQEMCRALALRGEAPQVLSKELRRRIGLSPISA